MPCTSAVDWSSLLLLRYINRFFPVHTVYHRVFNISGIMKSTGTKLFFAEPYRSSFTLVPVRPAAVAAVAAAVPTRSTRVQVYAYVDRGNSAPSAYRYCVI